MHIHIFLVSLTNIIFLRSNPSVFLAPVLIFCLGGGHIAIFHFVVWNRLQVDQNEQNDWANRIVFVSKIVLINKSFYLFKAFLFEIRCRSTIESQSENMVKLLCNFPMLTSYYQQIVTKAQHFPAKVTGSTTGRFWYTPSSYLQLLGIPQFS
ncbi:Hypothetical_protein [Hexamita inflata]|uniref:Hypothetical_protein n=1 Tax=Hexamita inflata TaxID=28002 RepID=A0AA86PCK9_9EUKA|nr:Hypothetical protein HINF_LOCUS21067 [Hexamita inflata]